MDKLTLNHMTIYGMMHTFFLKYKEKFVPFSLICSLFGIVEDNRQKLQGLGENQGTDDTGIAEDVSEIKKALVVQVLLNAAPAAAKFHKLGNNTLSKQIKFASSLLLRMRPEILVQKANLVVDVCSKNLPDLVGTGVDVDSIAVLSSAISDYAPEVNDSRIAIRTKTTVTKEIKVTVRANQNIINNELKGAMSVIMVSDNKIYEEFLKMIVLPHEGVHSHHAPRPPKALVTVTAIHDVTSELLAGIKIKFAGKKGTFTTDEHGIATATITIGAEMGKATADGFISQSFAFTLTEEGYAITIRMVPVVL